VTSIRHRWAWKATKAVGSVVGDEAAAAERPTRTADERRCCCRKSIRRAQTDGCPKEGSVHELASMMENVTSRSPVRKALYILSDSR
jgi:hypothetical protein